MSNVASIANWFVQSAQDDFLAEPLGVRRLQTLLFCAQGWSLVIRDTQLFPEEMHFDPIGPQIPRLSFSSQKTNYVPTGDDFEDAYSVNHDEAKFLFGVWASLRSLTAQEILTSILGVSEFISLPPEMVEKTLDRFDDRSIYSKRSIRAFHPTIENVSKLFMKVMIPAPLALYQRTLIQAEREAYWTLRERGVPDFTKFSEAAAKLIAHAPVSHKNSEVK